MKLWEKIYLVVIVLFLVVLNICNILVFRSSYQKSVDSVKQTAESSWKYIAGSMAEDLAEMEGGAEEEWQLFQSYVSSHSTGQRAFELWDGQELRVRSEMGSQITYSASEAELFSEFLKSREEREKLFAGGEQTGRVVILEREEKKYTCTSGELYGTGYRLVIYENVTEVLRIWEGQLVTFVWVEMAASLMMAVVLFIIMRKFLEPVSRISEMTAKVAAGNYDSMLEVKGSDELSELARDINDMAEQVRENMEQKETEARNKQEFIDALSHEMRTPLTSVRGYAELVQNTNIGKEKQMEYMDYIVRESGRMVDITETLRQVILLKQEELETEVISLKELAAWLQEIVTHQMEGKRIDWDIHAEETEIVGNRVLAQIFFLNLMRNSFHACTENGHISVWFDREKAVVADDGTGMTKECQEHIFEPFYREDKSRSRKLGGTGLGMYLCRHIADRHHWELAIDSQKGVGTKIQVLFNNYLTTQ